ncbi:TetR/AcrR family transcriptional regulator [Paracoccus aminophilus]|nr:TetR/AcrR family transcriptional regulator [Paracoccus aminophilus]
MSRPLRQPREELRKSIVETSKSILDREGAEGLSARAIAREIGYTAASIYNVFESMSDILMEVNRETLAELQALFENLPREASPRLRLQALCLGYVAFMESNPARWNALFGGMRQRESFPDWYVGTIDQLKGRLGALLVEHAGECGHRITEAEALGMAENLFITIHGLLALDVGRRLDLFTRRSPEEMAGFAIDLTLAGLGAGSGAEAGIGR